MFDSVVDSRLLMLRDLIASDSVSVVSFDVFDTLLRRPLMRPEHMFFAIGEGLEQLGVDNETAVRFGEARIIAGERANHYGNLQGREDVGIDTVYQILVSMLPKLGSYADRIKEIELQWERSLLEVYPLGKKLFDFAVASGKRVVLTSDQYLPKSFIESVLAENGYSGYEHFFLSGEVGAVKGTGTLFDWLILRLNVGRDEVLHIGDNHFTDVEAPKRRGLKTGQIPQSIDLPGHAGRHSAAGRHATLGSVALARYLHTAADETVERGFAEFRSGIEFVGYTFYGPILAGIAAWLVRKLEEDRLDKILLFARDSEGLSKVLSVMYPQYAHRFTYVYASRRLLVYPSNDLTGIEIFRHYKHLIDENVDAKQFLARISGQGANLTDLSVHFNESDRMADEKVQRKMERLLDRYYSDRSAKLMDWQRDNQLVDYFSSVVGTARRIGVFDIGWRGNLQRSLAGLLHDRALEIRGLYVGNMYEHELAKSFIDADSLAFSCNYPIDVFDNIAPNIWPLELIFGGTAPSIIGIEKGDDDWTPIFESRSPSKDKLNQAAEIFQTSAVSFIRDALKKNRDLLYRLATPKSTVRLLQEYLANPAWIDAHFLSDFSWTANIDEELGTRLIALPHKKTGRSLARAKYKSHWPSGYEALLTVDDRKKRDRYIRLRGRVLRLAERYKPIRRGFSLLKRVL